MTLADASATLDGPVPFSESGLHIVRAVDQRPTSFLVMGERCSGTNLLDALASRNFDLTRAKLHQWKHGFVGVDAVPSHCLILAICRNAVSWIRSLYERPWHTTDEMRALDFSSFIRAEWQTRIDRRFKHGMYIGKRQMQRPVQQDRHPITGRTFTNAFELRKVKLAALGGLCERDVNVAFVRLETLVASPEAYLQSVAKAFQLELPDQIAMPDKRLGGIGSWAGRNKQAPKTLTNVDMDFMRSQLDLEHEATLGYRY